jgi:hypothetical protein
VSAKKIIVSLLILIALISYYYFLEVNRDKEAKTPVRDVVMEKISPLLPQEIQEKLIKRSAGAEVLKKVFAFKEEDVDGLKLTKDRVILLLSKEDKKWKTIEPPNGKEDEDIIKGLVTLLSKLVEITVVEENPPDLGKYGLAVPYAKVSIRVKNSPSFTTLLLGDDTPDGLRIYAKFDSSSNVFLVGNFIKVRVNRTFMRLL